MKLVALICLLFTALSIPASARCYYAILGPQVPQIAPQPGGWTAQPGSGIAMTWGDVPFPSIQPMAGYLVVQYDPSHNNPGWTCNWENADAIRFTVKSYSNSGGTEDERSDTFEFPFRITQAATWTIDLNDRWIRKMDLSAHNPEGWSPLSNSNYAGAQYTGIRVGASAKPEVAGFEWSSCLIPLKR